MWRPRSRSEGGGRIVAVDLEDLAYSTSAEEKISKLGFGDIVEIRRARTAWASPGDCSFGMTQSSFPRGPGASNIFRAIQVVV
jgi:hypothetical protein